jgi:hypothetical protein
MALTGRLPLAALAGVLVVFAFPAGGLMIPAVVAVLAVAVLFDLAAAASPRQASLGRTGATSTRLGEPAVVTLVVGNTGR